jgi:hypothetical protein
VVAGAKSSLSSAARRAQVNFSEPLKVLCSAEVRFVIIGGAAMVLQGSAFVTDDLDVLYARDAENIHKLVAALKPYEPLLRVPGGEVPFRFDERTIKNGLNFTLVTSLGWIDLLAEIAGIGDFEAAKKLSTEIRLGDQVVHVLSLSGLIKAKKAAGRRKDLASLPELEALEELERKTELPKFE